MSDDWMDDELIGILEGKKRPKRRWWAVAARPIPPSQAGAPAPPLDILTGASVACSFRKLSTAYAGSAIRVKRASDSVTQDIGFDGSGNFDVAGFSSFIGASSGTMSIWYDQSGNGFNVTPVGIQPGVSLTGINGLPSLVFTFGGDLTRYAEATPSNVPYTFACVAMRTGNFGSTVQIFGDSSFSIGIYYAGAVNMVQIFESSFSSQVACSDNVAHSLIALFNGAGTTLQVDATSTPLSMTASQMQSVVVGNGTLTGNIAECICWKSGLSAGNIAALQANQKAYWHTP